MVQLPTVWRDALLAREALRHPARTVILQLSYHPQYFPDRLRGTDIDFGRFEDELRDELGTILSLEQGEPSKEHPDLPYVIQTPRLELRIRHRERGGVVLAQLVGGWPPKASLPPIAAPYLRAELHEVFDLVPFDMDQAYRDYGAAMAEARAAVRRAAFGEAPHSPAQGLRDELDRQLLPARTVLQLIAKREQVVEAARADGVVVLEAGNRDQSGRPAADVLRIRLDTLSGAFVEDTNVSLKAADPAAPIPAEIVEASTDEVLVRPKRPSDLTRMPPPGSRVALIRQGEPKVDRAVAAAIARARQGTVVGDWDGLTRLLTSPESLAAVPVPSGVPVDPGLSGEQQDAVRRALATSQAFFIQGPPGTGKTTVITEIVRRLAERGERVLLAAPMHVAVDEVLDRLRDDPRVWAMRVAADASNIRTGLGHLREDEIKAGAVSQVLARLERRNENWPAEIARLRQRNEALERLQAAAAEHAAAAAALAELRRSGSVARLEAELLGGTAKIAGIMTDLSAADAAAAAAAGTAGQLAPWLEPAGTRAAETDARLADLRAALRRSESDHAWAQRAATAARQRLSEIAADMAGADVRLSQLPHRIAALRDAYANAWQANLVSFLAYLEDQELRFARRQQQHQAETAARIAAADARLAGIQARIARLRRQHQEATQRIGPLDAAAEADGRRAARAGEAARRADADYRAARARAGFLGKLADGVGFGDLTTKRLAAIRQDDERAGAERDRAANLRAAAQARADQQSVIPLLTVANTGLDQARRARASEARADAVQAADLEMCLTVIARLRDRFAGERDLQATLADLDQASLDAASAASLRPVGQESERVAAAVRTGRQTSAQQLAAAQADYERTRQSRLDAAEQHQLRTADLARCDTLVAQSGDRLADAQEAEYAQADAAQQAGAAASQLRADHEQALAAERAALAARESLDAELTEHIQREEDTRQRLGEATAQLNVAAAGATKTARRLDKVRAAVSLACDGDLPEDPAADIVAGRTRIDRAATLIRLEGRWRELVSQSSAADGGPAEQLGRAVLDATNLVCTTVAGIAGSPAAKNADFDTLILDEASRVIDADFLVPAVRARRWILVGDERQLPPYVDQETEQHIHALLALRAAERDQIPIEVAVDRIAGVHDHLLPRRRIRKQPTVDLATRTADDGSWAAHYREHLDAELGQLGQELALLPGPAKPPDADAALITSLALGRSLSRFEKCVTVPAAAGVCARLTTQRRMIAPIAELVREPVYGGDYHTPDEAELVRKKITPFTGRGYRQPVTFFDGARSAKSAELRGTGFINGFEADLVVGVLHIWDRMAGQGGLPAHPSFSVLAFYKAQAALIERSLARRPLRRLNRNVIDSIDKIQGQESDLVVISFVRAQRDKKGLPVRPRRGTGLWLQDIHRLNVAVTRARLALALVGDRPTLEHLSGDDEAERFYANLFRLLDSGGGGMQYVADPEL